jgi:hypothetical protein
MFCRPLATLITMTDGPIPDDRYVYRFIGPDGVETTGPIGINDTLRFDNLTPGPNTVELAHVAENCEVTSDGRRRQRVEIEPSGGGEIVFRVVCSDPERRPELLFFAASYEDGASGIVFRATDPNADIEQYYWDITDCAGTSVLPRGGRSRRGLYGDPRTRGEDTIQVVSAYEVGIPAEELQGRCTLLRVTDTGRNTTPAVEIPIRPPGGTPPFATSFNARFSGQTSLLVSLAVLDPDDDYVGSFAALRLRDGALGMSPDGEFDIGIYNSAGFGPNDDIPVVRLGEDQRLRVDQVFASIVYLFDARGNMTRLEDVDLFR